MDRSVLLSLTFDHAEVLALLISRTLQHYPSPELTAVLEDLLLAMSPNPPRIPGSLRLTEAEADTLVNVLRHAHSHVELGPFAKTLASRLIWEIPQLGPEQAGHTLIVSGRPGKPPR